MALYVPKDEPPFPKTILEKPEIKRYIENFGTRLNDLAVVARSGKDKVGLIWGRTYSSLRPGYGFISEYIPEISMAVKPEHRNRGYGKLLMEELENHYRKKGIKAISLSVDKRNPARHLYERHGFGLFSEAGTSLTMVKHLTRA